MINGGREESNGGAFLNNTRNLAVCAHSHLPESADSIRGYLAIHISNFCISLMQYWAIPAVMFVFAFIGVELMGSETEEPFGLDCDDLPTGTIANTIKENVFGILD